MTGTGFTVKTGLLCDGVRYEVNNKRALYGVYSTSLDYFEKPYTGSHTIYVQLCDIEPGLYNCEYWAAIGGDRLRTGTGKGLLQVFDAGDAELILPFTLEDFEGEGMFECHLRLEGHDPGAILNIPIRHAPPPPQ